MHQQKVILEQIGADYTFPYELHKVYHTHIYCNKGQVFFYFKALAYTCNKGEFVFWEAESDVREITFSDEFSGYILFVDKNFLASNIPDLNFSIDAIVYSCNNPILHADKADTKSIKRSFILLFHKEKDKSHHFYDEVLSMQMRIFLFEMWHIFLENYKLHKRSVQMGTLYERFATLVQKHCITEREVSFYSNKLNVSPKHINYVCKINTGITASE